MKQKHLRILTLHSFIKYIDKNIPVIAVTCICGYSFLDTCFDLKKIGNEICCPKCNTTWKIVERKSRLFAMEI